MDQDKILNIINHFGIDNQLKKFNEECYELIEAINFYKYVAFNSEGDLGDRLALIQRKLNIAEEIADCMVLLKQFTKFYKIDTLIIKDKMTEKINRTIERIKEGYYENNK